MKEKFHIPGVAGIIEKGEGHSKRILIQERHKPDAPGEMGLLEIPAGKIREFENLFDTLRREVYEETGLHISEIPGEQLASMDSDRHGYKVIGCEPFYISQNLSGKYPIMVITFLCRANGRPLARSEESENIRWIPVQDLKKMVAMHPERFYPMDIGALRKYLDCQN